MSATAPSSTSAGVRPLWLALLIGAIVLIMGALAYRASDLDRAVHARYEEAITLARLTIDAQQAGAALHAALIRHSRDAALRGGPDPIGTDAAERELFTDALTRSLQPVQALPLSTTERLQLAFIIETAQSLLRQPAEPAQVAFDQSLARFFEDTGGRMLGLAREAEAQCNSARLLLIAFSVLSMLLAGALLALAYRSQFANRRALERLSQLTQEDALTGIMNRRGLDAALALELARARRSRQPLTVVMIDLDLFKKFNDRRGHAAGDALLRGAAQAWARQLRPTDLIARYGGEEFTLVLASCDADQAALLVNRLRPLVPERQTFSAGIATWDDGESGAELLQRADLALAQAKKAGRNRSMIAGREPQATLPLQVAGG